VLGQLWPEGRCSGSRACQPRCPPRARAALARGGALAAARVSHGASPRARAAPARGEALWQPHVSATLHSSCSGSSGPRRCPAAACLTVALTLALGQLRPEGRCSGSRTCQPRCTPRAPAAPARGGALPAARVQLRCPPRARAAPARGGARQPHVSATLPLALGQLRPEESVLAAACLTVALTLALWLRPEESALAAVRQPRCPSSCSANSGPRRGSASRAPFQHVPRAFASHDCGICWGGLPGARGRESAIGRCSGMRRAPVPNYARVGKVATKRALFCWLRAPFANAPRVPFPVSCASANAPRAPCCAGLPGRARVVSRGARCCQDVLLGSKLPVYAGGQGALCADVLSCPARMRRARPARMHARALREYSARPARMRRAHLARMRRARPVRILCARPPRMRRARPARMRRAPCANVPPCPVRMRRVAPCANAPCAPCANAPRGLHKCGSARACRWAPWRASESSGHAPGQCCRSVTAGAAPRRKGATVPFPMPPRVPFPCRRACPFQCRRAAFAARSCNARMPELRALPWARGCQGALPGAVNLAGVVPARRARITW
jgi:hypothetical protein